MSNTRKKTSPIWQPTKEEMIQILDECKFIGEVLARFGLQNKGSNFQTLIKRLKEDDIDYSKFKNNKHRGSKVRRPLDELLVEKSTCSRTNLKDRLIKEGLLEQKCQICKMKPLWKGKKLTLVLDHINGINDDYRLENLRLLCPNCNSQTDTFAGKQLRRFETKKCYLCSKEIGQSSKKCLDCYNKSGQRKELRPNFRKVERPSKEWLEQLIYMLPYTEIGKLYGVTDNTVRKWCIVYKIDIPKKLYRVV